MPTYDEVMDEFRNYNKELKQRSETFKILKKGRYFDMGELIDEETEGVKL